MLYVIMVALLENLDNFIIFFFLAFSLLQLVVRSYNIYFNYPTYMAFKYIASPYSTVLVSSPTQFPLVFLYKSKIVHITF